MKPVLSATQSEQKVGGRSTVDRAFFSKFHFKEETGKVIEEWSSEKEEMRLKEGQRFQGFLGWKIACPLLIF